jgi:hypothetical protein
MKVKLSVLINSSEPLKRLFAQKVPARVAFLLGKARRVIAVELDAFEEQRNALVKEHGTEGKDGVYGIKPGEEGWEEFAKQYGELVAVETTLQLEPVPLSLLDGGSGIVITAEDMDTLSWLIAEDPEPPQA